MIISNKNCFIRKTILRWYYGEDINPYKEIIKIYPNLESWEPNDFNLKYFTNVKLNWNDGTSQILKM